MTLSPFGPIGAPYSEGLEGWGLFFACSEDTYLEMVLYDVTLVTSYDIVTGVSIDRFAMWFSKESQHQPGHCMYKILFEIGPHTPKWGGYLERRPIQLSCRRAACTFGVNGGYSTLSELRDMASFGEGNWVIDKMFNPMPATFVLKEENVITHDMRTKRDATVAPI